MENVRDTLLAHGHDVLIPLLGDEVATFAGDRKINFGAYIEEHGGIDAFPVGHKIWNMKELAMRDHFEKVDWCDAILVANYEKRGVQGYIGGNTLIEMGIAFYTHKPIYILNPVSLNLGYKDEILGMKPIILDDNVHRISL